MKTYRIVCNEGSLSGAGTMQKDIIVTIEAETKEEAEDIFRLNRSHQMYGRRIKEITEVSELNNTIENNINKYVFNK